jgi:GntR family transcriptional regulator, uxu operon transcriptional repressor
MPSPAMPLATEHDTVTASPPAQLMADEGVAGAERSYQRLAEQIVAMVASGEFKVGDRLPSERNLAERFEVSRTSLREAVIALEVQGMVEVRLGSGIYVCSAPQPKPSYMPMNEPGPFELLRARWLLEGELAAQAAINRSDTDIDRIYAAMAAMKDNFNEMRANEEADRMFHLHIAQAAGNGVLTHVVSTLWKQLRGPIWTRLEDHFVTTELRQASLDEHHQVFTAIVSRNAEGARQAMRAHIDRVKSEFMRGWS